MNVDLTEGEELFAYYLVTLKTGGKTKDGIRKSNKNISDKEIQNILSYYNLLDGMMVIVLKYLGNFTLVSSIMAEDKEKMKEALYLMEQNTSSSAYLGDYGQFVEDWENNDYISSFDNIFKEEEVEIIEKITHESNIIKTIENHVYINGDVRGE